MNDYNVVGFWKTVVDTMMNALIVVDEDGMIVAVNPATEEITGYSRDELIGSPCSILDCDMCTPSHTDEGKFTCDLFKTKQIDRRRCHITRKDGALLPAIKNAAILADADGNVTGGVETLMDMREIVMRDQQIARLSSVLKGRDHFHGIIGKSRVMQDVFDLVTDAAQSDAPIVIYGESGTGKELVAEAIHDLGKRKLGPFVKVNCAALSESLLESELFGHVKGAYTGADRTRKGRFEQAHKGDIFLDEIGDIPLSMQVKILRALQEKEFERVGDSTPIKVDVRIISATHQDLNEMIRRKEFRDDLFYRLNVIPIYLPPLRERLEDLPLLLEHFLEENRLKTRRNISGIGNEAMEALLTYDWPGNVRELINAIEYAFVVCRKVIIEKIHLPETIAGSKRIPTRQSPLINDRQRELDSVLKALRQTGGKKTEAARLLGISRQALWKKMKKLGIKADFSESR